MSIEFIVIGEKVPVTQFMQNTGVFEKFKFVGALTRCEQNIPQPAKQILNDLLAASNQEEFRSEKGYRVVGVIVPKADAAVFASHKVYSNGNGWITMERMCEQYGSKLEYIEALRFDPETGDSIIVPESTCATEPS